MGFTKPTKPIFLCDWQQLAGRSSSTGDGEVGLWVWCVRVLCVIVKERACVCTSLVCVGLPVLCCEEFHSLLPCVCSCAVTPIRSEMWSCVDSNHQSAHRIHTHTHTDINHSIWVLSDILVPPQTNTVFCYSPQMFKTKFITWSNNIASEYC